MVIIAKYLYPLTYSAYFTLLDLYGTTFPLQKGSNNHVTNNNFTTHGKNGDSSRMWGNFRGSGNKL